MIYEYQNLLYQNNIILNYLTHFWVYVLKAYMFLLNKMYEVIYKTKNCD